MTQPVNVVQPTPAPVAAEPTMEELAASMLPPEEPAPAPAEAPAEAAPEAEATAETTEPAAAEEPAPAAADEALERAAKAAQRAREGSKRYAETQRQLAEQAAQTQRAAYESEQLRRENAQARQREATLKQDPYKALKDLGMTDAELAQRAMRENSPEAATLRLEEQLNQERNARLALEQRLETQQRQAAMRQAEHGFLEAAADVDAFPELAVRRPAVQLIAAREALKQIAANGHETRHLSHAQIAEAAELWLARNESPKAKTKPVEAPPPKPKAKPSGVTLTNQQAQARTVAPAGWDSLSEEQQLAHIAAALPDPT